MFAKSSSFNQEHLIEDQEFLKNFLNNNPRTDQLELVSFKKERKQFIAVACRCGNLKMTIVQMGIRCQSCGILHEHQHYEKMRARAIWKGQTLAKSSINTVKKLGLILPPSKRRVLLWDKTNKRLLLKNDLRKIKKMKRIA